MKILALEPYYGGSHKAFLDEWSAHSTHDFTVCGLPAYKWKWRMRHAAVTLAGDKALESDYDVLFCSDMLDLATFKGLASEKIRKLPSIAYFHENQLTYPVQEENERDYAYAFINMTTALAADAAWFNSSYNMESFLTALEKLLKKMPDHQPLHVINQIRAKSSIKPQGIYPAPARAERKPGPIRILWAARWEHDKGPEILFDALALLKKTNTPFQISVIGEQFRSSPAIFAEAEETFKDEIDFWGYQETRDDYEQALLNADIMISTAHHEFFGITVMEGLAAGAWPLVPERLAYPETLNKSIHPDFFYDGSPKDLMKKIRQCAQRIDNGTLWDKYKESSRKLVQQYEWPTLAPILDESILI